LGCGANDEQRQHEVKVGASSFFRGASRAAPFLAAVLLMVCFLTFPDAPPDNDVDSSLSGVLSYAHAQGIQFGPDLVITYGPLGFLMFFNYQAHAAGLRMVVDVALCLVTAIGLCLAAWRLRPLWRWTLLFLFFWMLPNITARADLVIDTGLLCWGLLCFLESGRRLAGCVLAFTLLAAFAALAKIPFLFIAAASVALIACDLALRGQRRLAVGMAGGFGAAFLLGWVGSGQSLGNLGAYLSNGLAMARAYNGAQGWEGLVLPRTVQWVLAPVVLVMILLRVGSMVGRAVPSAPQTTADIQDGGDGADADGALGTARPTCEEAWARRALLLAWLLLLSFAVWKHGCVRVGRPYYLGFITVLALVLEVLPCARPAARRWARALVPVICGASLITLQMFWFVGWPASLGVPFREFGQHLGWLLNPAGYQRQVEAGLAVNRREAQLPRCSALIGRASVDVFDEWQAYALHNGWNYRPRPVFQSYVACDRFLMQLNEQFYLSPAAPEYVLFRLFGFDRKFPPLEDAPLLRMLLANYEPVLTEGRFLLLKRAAVRPAPVTAVRAGAVRLGQPIDLREFGDNDLWLDISLEPTWLGRLRQVFYRPPMVRLAAWREPGGKLLARNRAPPQMMSAGFLASPLLLNNEDVLDLYANRAITRPGAYSIELPPGDQRYWRDTVRYRVCKVQSRLGRCVPAELAARLDETMIGKRPAAASVSPAAPAQMAATTAKRPFSLFHLRRWRPTAPPLGGWEENLALGLLLAGPVASFWLLLLFAQRIKRSKGAAGWGRLAMGNFLVLLCLITPLLLAGEVYFRFFCDTTDSLAYTKICERWVQRHWRVNNAGCRDNVDYSPALKPGTHRVSFVGDSFTAGHGIKDVEDRFPNILRRAHPDWEVQVLANVGLDTGGELALMKKAYAQGYQAHEVVLVYCLNDIGDLMPPQADATARVMEELDQGPWLLRNSYMLNLAYHHYEAARDPSLANYFPQVREAYRGPLWEQQSERLKAFRDLVQSHGGRLAVVTFPFLHAMGPNYEYRFVHEKLDQLWQELEVPHLDLLPVYERLPSKQITVNRFDAHPNEFAARLAAEALDKWLTGRGR
jgi:hypothetical protein